MEDGKKTKKQLIEELNYFRNKLEKRQKPGGLSDLLGTIHEIACGNDNIQETLASIMEHIGRASGCGAVGLRLLDDEGMIPYESCVGFARKFCESETPPSIHSDKCLCVDIIKGKRTLEKSNFTAKGSFYSNNMPELLSSLSNKKKEKLRHIHTFSDHDSMAMIPLSVGGKSIGLLHISDRKKGMVPLELVESLEESMPSLANIVSRLKSEEALRVSEEKYRMLVENANSIILTLDRKGVVTYINKYAQEFFGYPEKEIVGREIVGTIVPRKESSGRDLDKMVQDVLRHPEKYPVNENENIKKNGDKVWMAWTNKAHRDKRNRIVEVLCVGNDITHIKQNEQKLREEQTEALRLKTFLENVVDSMVTGLMVMDGDGKVLILNDVGQKIFKVTATGVLHKPVTDISPDLEKVRVAFDRSELSRELEVKLKNGDVIPIGYRSTGLRRAGDITEGVITVFQDLTEINEMRNELKEKDKLATIGRISGGIAHEIKNPLFAITSGIQLLRDDLNLNEEQAETFDIIFGETMRVDRLIKRLMHFTFRQDLKKVPLDLNRIIDDIIRLDRGLLKEKNISIRKEVPGNMPRAVGDSDRLKQVLINLIQNAIDASGEGGKIEILCGKIPDKNADFIKVMDRGTGVPEDMADKIFEPFFTTKQGNSGMGLALSKKIIKNLEGSLTYEPRRGGGSVFTVILKTETRKKRKSR